jgi:hypothetical protein
VIVYKRNIAILVKKEIKKKTKKKKIINLTLKASLRKSNED